MTVTIKKRKSNAKADSNDIQAAIDDFGQKYHCDSCSKDITHLVIIRCAECPDFDLCVDCFSIGHESKDHKRDHSYRVIDVLDYPIFERDWGADEEILMVEGLEMFGLGNWEHIAEHVVTKNSKECLDHYNNVYVASDSWPYPDMSDKFEMTPGKRARARPPGYVVKKLPKCPRAPASQPVNHEIAGYMPGRKEFEHEYENDAEQIVKDIEFLEEDTKEDTELKSAILNIYNRTLNTRLKRKEFIFDRGLTDFRKVIIFNKIQSIEKKRNREERDLFHRYRVFAKMQTAEDFDLLMEGLVKENRLRTKIASLQEYLRMGVQTIKESTEYERDNLQRANAKATGSNIVNIERSNLRRGLIKDEFSSTPSTPRLSMSLNIGGNRKIGDPLDVTRADGYDLLSELERHLCSGLRLFPRAYLAIKDIILKEYALKGFVKKRSIRSLIKIDVNKTNRIFDFFLEMGWISNKGST